MATRLSTIVVSITGDDKHLIATLQRDGSAIVQFQQKVDKVGGAATAQARGFSNLARGFTNAAGQSGVLNSEISILASSVGNVGLVAAGAGIGFGALVGGIGASIAASVGFETAITKVGKTAGLSKEETKAFGDSILEMSTRLPIAASELAKIGEVAGQLGISGTQNLSTFVEEIAKLSSTTSIDASSLASSIGLLLQVFNLPIGNVKNLSAEITDLGNTMNSTETEILDISTRIAGVGAALDIPIASLLAISSTAAAVTGDVEATSSAIQRTFLAIHEAAGIGGDIDKLSLFASVAGITTDAFQALSKTNPDQAFALFIEGLRHVENFDQVLNALELSDVRVTKTLLALAQSNVPLTKAINDGTRAAEEAKATNEELGRTTDTTAAQFQILKNNINATAIEIGNVFNPAVAGALDGVNGLFASMEGREFNNPFPPVVDALTEMVERTNEAMDKVSGLNDTLGHIPGPEAIDALASAFGFLADNAGIAFDIISLIPGPLQGISQGISLFNRFTGSGGGEKDDFRNGGADLTDLLGLNKAVGAKAAKDNADAAFARLIGIPPGLQSGGGGSGGGSSGPSAADIAAQSLGELSAAFEEFHAATGQSITDFLALIRVSEDKASLDQRQMNAEIGLKAAQIEATDGAFKLREGLVSIAESAVSAGITIEAQIAKVFAGIAEGFQSAFGGLFGKPSREQAQLQLAIDKQQLKVDQATAKGKEDKAAEAALKSLQNQKKLLDDKASILQDEATLADQTLQTEKEREFSAKLYTIAIQNSTAEQDRVTGIASLQAIAQQNYVDALLGGAQAINSASGISAEQSNLKFFNSLPDEQRTNLARLLEGMAGAGQLPSFAVGTPSVPRDMLAMVHRGERIIPASQNGESGVGGNIAYITINNHGDVTEAQSRRIARDVKRELQDDYEISSLSGQRLPISIGTR